MSLILDALRRADAERERGAVPGLHARQVAIPATQADDSARNRLWLAFGAAVLALGGIAAGVWIWQMPASPVRLAAVEPSVARPPLAAPVVPLTQPVPPPTSIPAASLPAVTAPRAVASSPAEVTQEADPKPVPKPQRAAPAVATQPPSRPKPEATPKAADLKVAEPNAATATPAPLPLAKASASQATQAAAPLLSDLPEDIRRQIPPLTITGSVYSANPKQRLLLVNNEVLNQGGLAAPGVTLEEIRKKGSVFIFRGTRFLVAH